MDEGLAPGNKGFNIEGLTARADGKSLLLGLRNPLLGEDFNQAVLIPLRTPKASSSANSSRSCVRQFS